LRSRLLHQSARGKKIGGGRGDVLIRDVDLVFDRVQLRIAKRLPPFAARGRVLRLRDFPIAVFFVGGWSFDRRSLIFRADVAAAQEREKARDRNAPR